MIRRRYALVSGRWGERQVHYRCGGRGPLLLMLHQSPQSSAELVPLMRQWEDRFTVLAPDSPGYGLSDPLGVREASLDDFAAATLEFLDAVGAQCFGIYGFHTAGMIGLALADRFPGRVAAVSCNGVAVLSNAERERILAEYLPPFEPHWDGSHLAWLWARIREQTVFFPWHERRLACRMDFPMPPAERQQASVLEFLRAADHYGVAYRAAFVYRAEEVVARLGVPTLITAAEGDPLHPHLARLPATNALVDVVGSPTPREAQERCLAHVLAHAAPPPRLQEPVAPQGARPRRTVFELDGGVTHALVGGAAGAPPVLILHDAGSSSARVASWAESFAASRFVVAPDLPGHGESERAGAPVDVAACAATVRAILMSMQIREADVVGIGAGGAVALALPTTGHFRLRKLAWSEPPAMPAADLESWRRLGLPSFAADWHGGHLSRAWHTARDARLFFPWFLRNQQGIRWQEPDLDERSIQAEVTDLLKADGAWQELLADVWQKDVALRIERSGLGPMTVLCATESSPWRAASEAAARVSRCSFAVLGDRSPASGLLQILDDPFPR